MNNELMSVYRVSDGVAKFIFMGQATHTQIINGALHEHYAHLPRVRIMGVLPSGYVNIYEYEREYTKLMFYSTEITKYKNGDYDFVNAILTETSVSDWDVVATIECGIAQNRWSMSVWHSWTQEEIAANNELLNVLYRTAPNLLDMYKFDHTSKQRIAGGLQSIPSPKFIAQV